MTICSLSILYIMCLKDKVKDLIKTINFALRQLDGTRRIQHIAKIQRLIKTFPPGKGPENVQKLYDGLQYRLKFLKVAYPYLNFTPAKPQEPEKTSQKNKANFEYIFEGNPEVLEQNKREQAEQEKPEVTVEHGEIKKMMRERVEVDFKNWYVGNSDPEDLKRHKQMLERQYFKGPFWEKREKPKPSAMSYLEDAVNQIKEGRAPPKYHVQTEDKPLEQEKPKTQQQVNDRFETIKR